MRYREPFTVFPRKMKSGLVVWYYQTYDNNNRRTTARSTGQTSKGAARVYCNKLYKEDALVPNRGSNLVFAKYAENWWIWDKCEYVKFRLSRRELSRKYIDTGKSNLKLNILPYFKNMKLKNLTSYDIEKWLMDGSVTNSYNNSSGIYVPDPYGLIFSDEQTSGGETRTVSYNYDVKNRLTNMITPSGESVSYNHNGLDQITSMPGFITGDIEYADNSYLSGYTLANNVTLNREYDDKLRLTRLDYNNGIEELKKFTFSYDREDNIIQKNSDYFSYDGKNQLKSASLSGEESAQEYPYEGEGKIMDIHPDVLGEETMVLTQDDLTLDWGAKSLGIDLGFGYRVKRIILKPTSNTTRVTEDNLQVFASLYNLEDYYTEPVAFTYEKDDTTGMITILFEDLQFARFIKIHSHFYEMDETGASLYNESTMTLEKTDPFDVFILSSGRNEFYTYDPKGNREKLSYFTTSFTSYDYSYYVGSDLIKTDGKYGYRYDANGNMTEKGSIYTEMGDDLTIAKEDEYFRYEYDLLNRLKRVYSLDEATGNEVFVKSYDYNASGMRILAEDSEGIKTQYTFDTGGKVVEKETDGTIRNFFYLGSKVVAHKENGETLYYGTDHLGSSVLMTDATGATVWTGAVTPFGDAETTEGLSEHVMFTGKELDTDTGLYYYNARWYDPGLGRFITEDPVRDGPNWFVYVNNNPLKFVDPSGLREVISDDMHGNPIFNNEGYLEDKRERISEAESNTVNASSQDEAKNYSDEAQRMKEEYNRAVVPSSEKDYGGDNAVLTGKFEESGGAYKNLEEPHPGIDLTTPDGASTLYYTNYEYSVPHQSSHPIVLSVPGTNLRMRLKHSDSSALENLEKNKQQKGVLGFSPGQIIVPSPTQNNGSSSTAPHFHFEITNLINGIRRFVNPIGLNVGSTLEYKFYTKGDGKNPRNTRRNF